MFTDFNKTIASAGGAMGAATPKQLTPAQIQKIAQIVKNPKFDIYVGKSDNKIRRLVRVGRLHRSRPPQQAQFQGATGGNADLLDRLREGRGAADDHRARGARPISELQQQLGGLGGGLGGLGGSGSSGSGSGSSGSGSSGSGSSGGSGGSGSNPTPAQFQKYSKCLQKADPSNTAAIQKCAAAPEVDDQMIVVPSASRRGLRPSVGTDDHLVGLPA